MGEVTEFPTGSCFKKSQLIFDKKPKVGSEA